MQSQVLLQITEGKNVQSSNHSQSTLWSTIYTQRYVSILNHMCRPQGFREKLPSHWHSALNLLMIQRFKSYCEDPRGLLIECISFNIDICYVFTAPTPV